MPLHRGDAPYGGYNEPAYAKTFRNTPKHWTAMSKWLNNITGGDDVSPGHIDIAPETLRLAITSYWMPGVSSQIVDPVFSLATKALGDEAISVKEIPGLSSFVGLAPDERAQERAFFARMNDWRQTVHQIDEYGKQGRWDDADRAAKRLGDGDLELGNKRYDNGNSFDADIRGLNKERRQAESENDKEWITEVNDKRKKVFAGFGRMER